MLEKGGGKAAAAPHGGVRRAPATPPRPPSRPPSRQPSIKDIARLARVSHPTVSRALQNSPLVNAETAAKIRKTAEDQGYRASADVSVTGFDDLFFAAYLTPALSTVRQPMRQMGQMAMENLFKLMSGPISGQESVAQIRVESELIVRGSTGKARKRQEFIG